MNATVLGSGASRKPTAAFSGSTGQHVYRGDHDPGGYVEVYHAQGWGRPTGTVLESGTIRLVGIVVTNEALQVDGGWCSDQRHQRVDRQGDSEQRSDHRCAQCRQVLTLAGLLEGTGGFTKIGEGTLILAGSVANTYAGDTTVNTGRLELDVTSATPFPAARSTIGDTVGGMNADEVRYLRVSQIRVGSPCSFATRACST